MTCKLWTFISHSSGSWEIWDQVTGRFIAWWGPASTLTMCFHCNLTWWMMRGFSGTVLQGCSLIHNLLTSRRPYLRGRSDLGLGFQYRKCGGMQAFSPESLLLTLEIILQAHSQLKVFALSVLSSWNTHIFTWWTCPWHSNLGSNVIILRTSSSLKNKLFNLDSFSW